MKKLLLLSLVVIIGVACKKKVEDEPTTNSDGSQTAAGLAGTYYLCSTHNTFMSTTYAYLRIMTLNSDGTYSFSLRFSDQTSCATSYAPGGAEIGNYTQAGTFTVGGTAGTPSTGTKVTFTVATATLTLRGGSYNGNAIAQNLITAMNACTPAPNFSTSSDDTKSYTARTCSGFVFAGAGDTFSNVMYNSGSALQSGNSSGQDITRTGGSTFPTSYTLTYIK